MNPTIDYTLFLADSSLILAQQNAAWCGHGPVLEQDIALSNISLDLLGQARYFYQYAAELLNKLPADKRILPAIKNLTEDSLAYLRDERAFRNCLLVEQPNGDWGQTILRQYLFSAWQLPHFERLTAGGDLQLAAIAEKAVKEARYHLRWSSEWVLRLGDGTDESHRRMQIALDKLWRFTAELFEPEAFELELFDSSYFETARNAWQQEVGVLFNRATLSIPDSNSVQKGGKTGRHTEGLGHILAEMQILQRSYPGAEW